MKLVNDNHKPMMSFIFIDTLDTAQHAYLVNCSAAACGCEHSPERNTMYKSSTT